MEILLLLSEDKRSRAALKEFSGWQAHFDMKNSSFERECSCGGTLLKVFENAFGA